jgi:hypothetical protein
MLMLYNLVAFILIRPLSYVNTDLLVHLLISALKHIPRLVLSYDIMCQYIINLFKRLPPSDALHKIESGKLQFDIAIPKFHLPAHVSDCHADFSLNNLPGVRRVDGEANERNWAASNKAAGSTVDMGPGARKDTLNGFFSALNWRKTIRLGMYSYFLSAWWFS